MDEASEPSCLLLLVRQRFTLCGVHTLCALVLSTLSNLSPTRLTSRPCANGCAFFLTVYMGHGGSYRAGKNHLPCGLEKGSSQSTGGFEYAPIKLVTGAACAAAPYYEPLGLCGPLPLQCSYKCLSANLAHRKESETAIGIP